MDSVHCKDCGNPLQDSFVIVDPEREDELNSKWRNTKSSKNVIASLNATLKLKGKITDLVERSTKVKPRSREANEVSQNKSKHKQVKFQDIEGFSEDEKDKKSEAKNRKLEICFDCRRLLLEELDKQTQEAQLERTNYMQYAHRALNAPLRPEEVKQEKQRLMTEILQLKEQEASLEAFYGKVLKERENISSELKELELECEGNFKELEESCYDDMLAFQYEWKNLEDEYEEIVQRINTTEEHIRELDNRNVYQDTFFIYTEEKIATINGLRFGRLPDTQVEWEEINAAWGQAALLLYIIARQSNFPIPKYRIRAQGNRTTIEVASSGTILELFGTNELSFGSSWFWFGKKSTFSDGMVAFLECLNEVSKHATKISPTMIFATDINGDKIGGISIRIQSNTEVSWTQALKYVLLQLNQLLAWVSSRPKLPAVVNKPNS